MNTLFSELYSTELISYAIINSSEEISYLADLLRVVLPWVTPNEEFLDLFINFKCFWFWNIILCFIGYVYD